MPLKHYVLGLLCVLLGFSEGTAQQTVRFLHPTAYAKADAFSVRKPAAPAYDVVALRVAFQPDTTRFTTGNGTFSPDLFGGLTPNIDPFPHDAGYFQAHLDFLEAYMAHVSAGQTVVRTHLIPEVVQVSQTMGRYSPTGPNAASDAETAKLAALVAEAWTLADAQATLDVQTFDPERTIFLLFHAGAGRDIELLGTTLDKTPEDLPSLFFNQETLTRLGGSGVSFKGLPVTHTAVLPETESRLGFDFIGDEPFLIELSINGLIAASVFNFLEVPDLFDTATGTSAIGPFGLMDPLGIFAFNGLFPPEPTAWTKYYLGWIEPQVLAGPQPRTATLAAGTEAVRVPISEGEFFLVENRHRDLAEDGLVLQVYKDGTLTEQRVAADDDTFNSLDQSGFIGGVVVGVDDYDWALPGGFDSEGVLRQGGLLIWHVDERILRAGMPENRVNADPFRRAIDLEEADGGQDLGFPNPNPFGPSLDRGTPFDFFYEDNPVAAITSTGEVRLYQNRFGPDTEPSSDTNAGGPSFIVLDEFSPAGTQMTFRYAPAAPGGVAPEAQFAATEIEDRFGEGGAIAYYASEGEATDYLLIQDGTHIGSAADTHWRVEQATGTVLGADATLTKGSVYLDENGERMLARLEALPNEAVIAFVSEQVQGSEEDPDRWTLRLEQEAGQALETALVGIREEGQVVFYAGFAQGRLVRIAPREGVTRFSFVHGEVRALAAAGVGLLAVVGTQGAELRTAATIAQEWTYDVPAGATFGQAVFGTDAGGRFGVVPVVSENSLLILEADGGTSRFTVGEGALASAPVLVDVDGDGYLDILTTVGARLLAFSRSGTIAPGFPIALSAPAVAQPLVARFTGQEAWTLLVASTDGNVYAYALGNGGRQVDGFPLAAGGSLRATPVLHGQTLYTVSEDGSVRGWTLENLETVWWGEQFGNARNQSYVEQPADTPTPERGGLLVTRETYNWPNPITDGETHLRFLVTEAARIEVTIVDLAGTVVAEQVMENARPNLPEELRWQTDAESGLYFARIKATAASGTSETHLIKMAIVR